MDMTEAKFVEIVHAAMEGVRTHLEDKLERDVKNAVRGEVYRLLETISGEELRDRVNKEIRDRLAINVDIQVR